MYLKNIKNKEFSSNSQIIFYKKKFIKGIIDKNNLTFVSSSLISHIFQLTENNPTFGGSLLILVLTGHSTCLIGNPFYVSWTVMSCEYHMTQLKL